MIHIDSLKLTIVIPVATGDETWKFLLQQLAVLASDHNWILSVADRASDLEKHSYSEAVAFHQSLCVVSGPEGRAEQINRGIAQAETDWLWVLHADSELSPLAVAKLLSSLMKYPEALHYFDLAFTRPGPRLMNLNHWGVRVRSSFLQMPFGDQGFAFHRKLWDSVGGFPLDLSYGEDHVFVWRLRQAGFYLRRVPVVIRTSPRKYLKGGWMHTTMRHLQLTFQQARPEWIRLWRMRLHRFRRNRSGKIA